MGKYNFDMNISAPQHKFDEMGPMGERFEI